MGYRRKRRVFKLVFEDDHDLHGLEITAVSMTLGEVRDLQTAERSEGEDEFLTPELKAFVGQIKEWNLEDEEGNELPISVDSLLTLGVNEVRSVIDAYSEASLGTQIEAPLGGGSASGEVSPEASLPMET